MHAQELSEETHTIRPRDRSNSNISQKRQRTESEKDFSKMAPEDFISIIQELEAENVELSEKYNKLQTEMDKIHIQIGKGTLDWIFKKDETGQQDSITPFGASKPASLAGAAKSVTLIAKLDPELDTTNLDGKSMDQFFKSNEQWPTLQHFSKRNNEARLVFNNAADAKKAEEIIKEDPKLTGTVKSISEQKLNYPVVAFATGTNDLEELQTEIEYRNALLRGNISSIKILSREKGHLDHISPNCPSKTEVCGKCAEKTHKTKECEHLDKLRIDIALIQEPYACINIFNNELHVPSVPDIYLVHQNLDRKDHAYGAIILTKRTILAETVPNPIGETGPILDTVPPCTVSGKILSRFYRDRVFWGNIGRLTWVKSDSKGRGMGGAYSTREI
ncbi:hypothetical protein OUZ56_008976 [Daphnia magna]|uniref:Uncharacterized protein n=1 Tax=Daphnia magna TaxID=35525 RepID=A0ABR0AEX9_9CRUS|nr:hypothetical protein OUZ56_008976 [Daphnia magna]